MATMDTGPGAWDVSRRDFLKATAAATAAAGCGIGFAFDAETAAAYEDNPDYTIKSTTCPYCSASCGQRVVVDNVTDEVVTIYGDFESPFNSGGLCAKGAGTLQLVNNDRRIGAFAGTHPDNPIFAYDNTYTDGIAYKRVGNGGWAKMDLQAAFDEIAAGDGNPGNLGLKAYRAADTTGWVSDTAGGNSKSVAFFGSSHLNNEPNYMYRKLIAEFGTSNTEHQARI